MRSPLQQHFRCAPSGSLTRRQKDRWPWRICGGVFVSQFKGTVWLDAQRHFIFLVVAMHFGFEPPNDTFAEVSLQMLQRRPDTQAIDNRNLSSIQQFMVSIDPKVRIRDT